MKSSRVLWRLPQFVRVNSFVNRSRMDLGGCSEYCQRVPGKHEIGAATLRVHKVQRAEPYRSKMVRQNTEKNSNNGVTATWALSKWEY